MQSRMCSRSTGSFELYDVILINFEESETLPVAAEKGLASIGAYADAGLAGNNCQPMLGRIVKIAILKQAPGEDFEQPINLLDCLSRVRVGVIRDAAQEHFRNVLVFLVAASEGINLALEGCKVS